MLLKIPGKQIAFVCWMLVGGGLICLSYSLAGIWGAIAVVILLLLSYQAWRWLQRPTSSRTSSSVDVADESATENLELDTYTAPDSVEPLDSAEQETIIRDPQKRRSTHSQKLSSGNNQTIAKRPKNIDPAEEQTKIKRPQNHTGDGRQP